MACIPAFNEAANIRNIILEAKKYCTNVIVCDDGSVDETSQIAKSAGAIVIKHHSNLGYGASIATLFDFCRQNDADVAVTLDSDGQHDASEIPMLTKPILEGNANMVIGSRFLSDTEKKIPRYRSVGIKTITKLTQAASYNDITDSQSGFRAYSNEALSKLYPNEDGMAASTEILLKAKEKNLKISEVPITISYGDDSSTQNPVSHGLGVFSSVLLFISLKHPLLFYGLTGIGCLIVATLFMNNALELFSASRYVSTPLILLSIGATIAGIVLLATGVILFTMVALFKQKVNLR